jgi:ubiquitin-conjugating enzyme E2 Q
VLSSGQLLDQSPQQHQDLAALIDSIPKISTIKTHLDGSLKLKDIDTSSGAITVLRWIVGSCRAYLKETKADEGVLNSGSGEVLRQFLFVVGSPEQENNFKQEIVTARATKGNCERYPTLLAFHGTSPLVWWFLACLTSRIRCREVAQILRTGLDYNETVCGRVSPSRVSRSWIGSIPNI